MMKTKHYFWLIMLVFLAGMLSFSIETSLVSDFAPCEVDLSTDSCPNSQPTLSIQEALPAVFVQFHSFSFSAPIATQRNMSRLVSSREQCLYYNVISQIRRFHLVTSYCHSLRKQAGYYTLALCKLLC